ncbi:MAG: acetyl-CoA carboxylase biotin carboxylase subunit [bacterium]|nr:acetyl-CoA carboxylase biotin carboxylase subunit [bacterium]
MFNKILIANRGEIALRIIRACKELGIKTVAVYSEADRESLHVKRADEAICIGPAETDKSYLNIPNIISAAEITDAEAIHPGYGFLAENYRFAEICESCRIKFIGPSSEAIRKMGNKIEARKIMEEAGLPVVKGSGNVENEIEAVKIAKEITYPVIIKAAAGGGGKGMRIVHTELNLAKSFLAAKAEAKAAFGNDSVYIEKYIDRPRHIEIQLLGDEHGQMVHLGERECSIQRRHQKLIEEAFSPLINDEIRKEMGETAVKGAKAVGYAGVGTMEFLADKDKKFYFMEMNTRIQVEHPVTEFITNIDLLKEQIRVAAGEKLGYNQSQINFNGHAIECRINAEDPDNNFVPCPGEITKFIIPGGPGVRVDTHVYNGYTISPFYDSMVGKLIVFAKNRKEAIARMDRALSEFVVEGIKTTVPFHLEIMRDDLFKRGEIDTHFIENVWGKK